MNFTKVDLQQWVLKNSRITTENIMQFEHKDKISGNI